MLDELPSSMSYSADGMRSMLIHQQFILNKVPLNIKLHKTRVRVDQWMSM